MKHSRINSSIRLLSTILEMAFDIKCVILHHSLESQSSFAGQEGAQVTISYSQSSHTEDLSMYYPCHTSPESNSTPELKWAGHSGLGAEKVRYSWCHELGVIGTWLGVNLPVPVSVGKCPPSYSLRYAVMGPKCVH